MSMHVTGRVKMGRFATDKEAMIGWYLLLACVLRCNSQSPCEAVDGEITYPDRCDSDRSKDLCRRGQYLKISSILCGANGSDDDRCERCPVETYMPVHNFCTSCRPTTKCKENEIESRPYTFTRDRECIPKPIATTAPAVSPNCPVCECQTQSSCQPCPTPVGLLTASSSYTSPTPIPSSTASANVTQEPVYLKGVEDFWMWLAIGLGTALVVAILVIVILVYTICRKRGVRRRRKERDNNDAHPENVNCCEENEMGNRRPQNGARRHEPDAAPNVEVPADIRHDEIGNRSPQNGPNAALNHSAVLRQNDSRISSPEKDEALEPLHNPVPAEGTLNHGPSSKNTTLNGPRTLEDSNHEHASSDLDSGGWEASGGTHSTDPLLRNSPKTEPPREDSRISRDKDNGPTEAKSGSKDIQTKWSQRPKPNPKPKRDNLGCKSFEQPLLGHSTPGLGINSLSSEETMPTTVNSSNIPLSSYGSHCILEANTSTEKPCERTTICNRTHMDFVKDNISIKNSHDLFEKLKIPSNRKEAIFYDKRHETILEQIRGVLNFWLESCSDPTIRKLLHALDKSNSNEVVRLFTIEFDVKQKE